MDYESMSLVQLRELAKERSIKGTSALKKGDLIKLLSESIDELNTESKKSDIHKDKVKKTVENEDNSTVSVARENPIKKSYSARNNNQDSTNNKDAVSRNRTTRSSHVMSNDKAAQNVQVVQDAKIEQNIQVAQNIQAAQNTQTTQVAQSTQAAQNTQTSQVAQNTQTEKNTQTTQTTLDSGVKANGILEVMTDGFGFIRSANYLPGDNDVYVSPSQIRRFNLKTGDIICGNVRVKSSTEKFGALLYISSVNGLPPASATSRIPFEDLIPIFPDERIRLENENTNSIPMRIMDLIAPIGKGQRGMIVSPPKTGKTTLLKQVAKSISRTYRDMHVIVLLIDERPEEVTDIRESIEGPNVEVIYSTFDELPEHHKRVSEMVLERAKRLVEHKKDVVILLDSITRLARAYNLTVPPSGRTLTGGLDPAALHMPKKFFGSARNMRDGGSLTILATALVETGSKMDDVVFEEFKGTGNMELVLDRKLSEKRIFPAIDIAKSGTRRDDLLLNNEEREAVYSIHREMSQGKSEDTLEEVLKLFVRTKNNKEFIQLVNKSLSRR